MLELARAARQPEPARTTRAFLRRAARALRALVPHAGPAGRRARVPVRAGRRRGARGRHVGDPLEARHAARCRTCTCASAQETRASASTGVRVTHTTLQLGASYDGPTELGSLVLRPEARGAPGCAGQAALVGALRVHRAPPRLASRRRILAEMRAAIDAPRAQRVLGRLRPPLHRHELHRGGSPERERQELHPRPVPRHAVLRVAARRRGRRRARPRARRGGARAAPARAARACTGSTRSIRSTAGRSSARRAARVRADRRRRCSAALAEDAPPEARRARDRVDRGRRRVPRGRDARRARGRRDRTSPKEARKRLGLATGDEVGWTPLPRRPRRRAAMAEPSRFAAARRLHRRPLRAARARDGEIALEDPGDTRAPLGAFPFGARARASARSTPRARLARVARRGARDARRRTCAASATRCATDARAARARDRDRGRQARLGSAHRSRRRCSRRSTSPSARGSSSSPSASFALAPGQVGRWRASARGVLAVLGPFNFPGHLVHGHVVPALATGNCVVVKPSEQTPATGQVYAELAAARGLPARRREPGAGRRRGRRARSPRTAELDGVLFTGSWAVGPAHPRGERSTSRGSSWRSRWAARTACSCARTPTSTRPRPRSPSAPASPRASAAARPAACSPRARSPTRSCEKLARLFRGIAIGHSSRRGRVHGPGDLARRARATRAGVGAGPRPRAREALVAGGPCEGPRPGHYVRPEPAPPARARPREPLPERGALRARRVRARGRLGATRASRCSTRPTTAWSRASSRATARSTSAPRATLRVGALNWNATTVGASSKLPFGGVKQSGNDRAGRRGVDAVLHVPAGEPRARAGARAAAHCPGFPRLA